MMHITSCEEIVGNLIPKGFFWRKWIYQLAIERYPVPFSPKCVPMGFTFGARVQIPF